MNAHSKIKDGTAAVFKLNRSQAVRIPKQFAFPDTVKEVVFRRQGNSLVISPKTNFWRDFFNEGPNLDFPDRFSQGEYEEREAF